MISAAKEKIFLNNRTAERLRPACRQAGIHRSRVAVIHSARGRGLYFPRHNCLLRRSGFSYEGRASLPLAHSAEVASATKAGRAGCSCGENIKKLDNLFFKIIKTAPVLRKKTGKKTKPDIFLLGKAEMKRLKKKFLPREKGPANVLSFGEPVNWPNPGGGSEKLGEIYLNLDLTGGEMDKLAPLFLHGLLHLLGYDHKKKGDRIRMENLEEKIINKISNS